MNYKTKTVIAAFLGLTLALVAFVGAVPAQASSFDANLTVGSTGQDVTALQTWLIENGFLSIPAATGYFGPMTQKAVADYQTSVGIAPAAGYVGPVTRAKLNGSSTTTGTTGGTTGGALCPNGKTLASNCMTAPGSTGALCPNGNPIANNCMAVTGSTSGSVSEGAGDISSVTLLGTPNAEAVGEGENNHKVLGFEIEADNGSDLSISSVKVEFDRSVGTEAEGSSSHINDYVGGVSVWQGTKKVGSADVADFSKTTTGVYGKSIALSGATVPSDKKVRFYVTVDGNNTVDSTDRLEQMGIRVTSIRFSDATGAILTFTPESITDIQQYFTIESQADASDAKLTLTESADNPNAGVVQVDDGTKTTDNVTLLKFKIKATGSDLWIDELPVLLTAVADENGDVTDVTSSVTLTIDGQEFSETVSSANSCNAANCTVVFDKLDTTIKAGDSVDVTVSADIKGVGSTLTSGDTLRADINSTQRNAAVIAVGDSEGDDLGTSSTDRVGTVTGENQGFYNEGITVTSVAGNTATANGMDDSTANNAYGTFAIKFKVTAIGQDIYLDKTVAASSSTSASASGDNRVLVIDPSGDSVTGSGVITHTDSNSEVLSNTFKIQNGQTAAFTLTVNSTTNPDSFVQAVLYGLEYSTSGNDATGNGVYTLDMGVDGSYTTPTVSVQD